MSKKSCDNCQLKECDLSDCMSRKCGGGPTYPGHLAVNGICPLPRIGSKEWRWEWDARRQMYTSPKTSICIQSSFGDPRICLYYDVIIGLDGVPMRIGANLILRDAKILAEVRARRDWRRENIGQKC